mgnify:CR=1 FL=1
MNHDRQRRAGLGFRIAGISALALVLMGHVGSPDVFFKGKAGNYDVIVVIQPPKVVPGVARVTLRTHLGASEATIPPTY